MAKPPIVTKGVSKWSLNPDDNATADERINWQEGQPPSTVNNSARMMMARIREQYDLNQLQFKNIPTMLTSRFGGRIKDITADRYSVGTTSYPNTWVFYFYFDDKLTQDEYNDYKNGQLYLLTNLVANGLENDAEYKKMRPNTTMWIDLVFKVGNNTYTHVMHFNLNFFGIAKENTRITFQELRHFVNNRVLQIGKAENNFLSTSNMIPLVKERTYEGHKDNVTVDVKDPGYYRTWHYEAPSVLVYTDHMRINGLIDPSFIFPTSKANVNFARLAYAVNGISAMRVNTDPLEDATQGIKFTYRGYSSIYSLGSMTHLIELKTPLPDYPLIMDPTDSNIKPPVSDFY